MQTKDVRRLTMTAVMGALIFVVTWLVKIPIPISGGAYLNFGDIVIYMCGYIAGPMSAFWAAAVGSCLADIAGGALIYAIPTVIIKGVMGLIVGWASMKGTFPRYLIGCIVAGAVMVFGYALFEVFCFGQAQAVASIPFNLVQWGGSVAGAAALFEVSKRIRNDAHARTFWDGRSGRAS